jgi:endonuclease/exonuclease/phosphatase family metal-dependent hydrolase
MRLLTWNLQGRRGVDVERVRSHIVGCGAEIVALQEVRRAQARQLAAALGWQHVWSFKHAPFGMRAEGAALLAPTGLGPVTTIVLRPASRLSWRRRIALVAAVERDDEGAVILADVHLSPHALGAGRDEEVRRLVDVLRTDFGHPARPVIVAGDVNEEPPSAVSHRLEGAGWVDAWAATVPDRRAGDGATSWIDGPRTGLAPTRRLDVVFMPAGWTCRYAAVPSDEWSMFAELSDHLPVLVDLEPLAR